MKQKLNEKSAMSIGSTAMTGYVPKLEYEKVCKMLDMANNLIEKLYASGCLETESERDVQDYLGWGT